MRVVRIYYFLLEYGSFLVVVVHVPDERDGETKVLQDMYRKGEIFPCQTTIFGAILATPS
jgi:hypothetical protein